MTMRKEGLENLKFTGHIGGEKQRVIYLISLNNTKYEVVENHDRPPSEGRWT